MNYILLLNNYSNIDEFKILISAIKIYGEIYYEIYKNYSFINYKILTQSCCHKNIIKYIEQSDGSIMFSMCKYYEIPFGSSNLYRKCIIRVAYY